ncbi:MAG TPA: IPExxxVDY family protein [Bacteroidales bacterium]|nr:IPExxxVDY family protein [Bacteroidales bacterium]
MAKKTSLKLEYCSPFTALLVYSSQKGYRLAWLLNKHLDFELKRMRSFEYTLPESRSSLHEIYGYYNAGLRMHIMLFSNKSGAGMSIISEKPIPDYILFLWNIPDGFDLKTFLGKSRKLQELQAISPLTEKLSGRYHGFFYDLEIFLNAKSPD